MSREILVIPFPHPGHLFPITELCKQLAARNYKITLFSSPSSSSSSLHQSIRIIEIPLSDPVHFQTEILDETLSNLVGNYFDGRDSSDFPLCAIVDEMIISWLFVDRISEFQVPVVSFFTSSASSAALSHAMDRVSIDDMTRGEILAVPGLPAEMALTSSSLPSIRCRPPWTRELEASGRAVSLIFNTCEDLERPFLDYVAKEAGKPVWGVGPLLPARFKDGAVRFKREGDASEDEVIAWLDSKPCGSVIYVSFGSLVNPTDEELAELAAGLEESNRPFVWVAQPNATQHDPAGRAIEGGGGDSYFSADMEDRVGTRGLVIRGWAPQLSILSHPSTGVYVCHCGWNSTVEAMGCGVPMLTWPVRGDQHHNAKLVTDLLKVGLAVKEGDAQVKKEDVTRGIERLAGDEEIKKRAAEVKSIFAGGFPKSSSMAIDSFLDFLTKK